MYSARVSAGLIWVEVRHWTLERPLRRDMLHMEGRPRRGAVASCTTLSLALKVMGAILTLARSPSKFSMCFQFGLSALTFFVLEVKSYQPD